MSSSGPVLWLPGDRFSSGAGIGVCLTAAYSHNQATSGVGKGGAGGWLRDPFSQTLLGWADPGL